MGKITVTLRVGNASWGRHIDAKDAEEIAPKIKELAQALAITHGVGPVVDGQIEAIRNGQS